ncbi:MAG: DUF3617 domain-containing protein [Sphingorhabdus sp.]
MRIYPRLLLALPLIAPRGNFPTSVSGRRFMKSKMMLAAAMGALIVGGCSGADEKPRKGKYKPEVELTKLEMPGITPELRTQAEAQMKTAFAAQAGGEQCFGGADKGDWKEMSQGMTKGMGGQCNTTRDNSTDDTVDFELKCTGTQMGNVTTLVKGKAESESITMDIDFSFEGLPTGETGKMGMKMTAKRIGDC